MQPRDFVYWLQGFFEISGTSSMTAREVMMVKNHLNLVFKHSLDKQYSDKDKDELQVIHDGNGKSKPDLEVMC